MADQHFHGPAAAELRMRRWRSARFGIRGFRFYIYGNGRLLFPPVYAEFCFYPELIRIFSVFHPIFNVREICLQN